ncbi:MAG TPA: hypothetical protein VGO93_22710 [Candidatus Xenobia bacterium]|jgi:hypothetical protein
MTIKVKSDGAVHEGKDAAAVVTAMKNSSPFNRGMSVMEYLPKVREWSGEQGIDVTSPEAFLDSLNRLGLIQILN